MSGLELLLGAALEAGLGLLAEAGFGDQIRDLKARLTRKDQKVLRAAFERAFDNAMQAAGEESLRPLLEHQPFREAVIAGLLDPAQGLDVQTAAEVWGEQLPAHARALRRFFSTLENALSIDPTWGPMLDRYQELRFRQDVLEVLRRRDLDVPARQIVSTLSAHLVGDGAIAQGEGAVAAGAGGIAVGGDVLGDVVRTVIERLVVEVAAPPSPGPQPDDVRRAYLEGLVQECGRMRLLGLDTSAGHAAVCEDEDVRLESVYVHLDTVRAVAEGEEGAPGRRGLGEKGEMERQRRLTALEAAAHWPKLVLTGGPGSGKSTFVSYLALCLALGNLPAQDRPFSLDEETHLPGWPGNGWPLPVRLTLRDFGRWLPADTTKGSAALLWQFIEKQLAPLPFGPALKKALLGGRVLVILDGLDEVPEGSSERKVSPRRLVLQAVEDFARRLSSARYLVTCRQASYVSPWTLRDFEVAPLAEFDQAKRDQFCKLWYAALAQRGQLDAAQVPGKVKGLQAAIRRPDLTRLAGNPLLLTVMALVHANEAELPEARALLYEKCVGVLLWLWERHKADDARPADLSTLLEQGQVNRTFFVRLLHQLAYDVHAEGGAQEGEADIRASVLINRLATLHPDKSLDWARDVATFIRERAGLLVERRGDEMDPVLAFPHRTFQEYLAACWLTEGEDTPAKAAELAQQGDHWWEVVKLAAGRLLYVEHKMTQPLLLLDFLCPEQMVGDPACWRLNQLAGEVLLELKPEQMLRDATTGNQVRTRLDRARHRLVEAIGQDEALDPRQRAEAGNVLAQLDDPRFQADAGYLPNEPMLGFVEVPGGPFLMGTREEDIPALMERYGGERNWYEREAPQHSVELPTYYIARYPVTQTQYWAFVQAAGHQVPASYLGFDTDRFYEWQDGEPPAHLLNHPVVLVSWHDARAYCAWLTEQLRAWKDLPGSLSRLLRREGWVVRLPTEAEWEKAARGGDGRVFPWGDEPDSNRINYRETNIGGTSTVGCFPGGVSPFGLLDASGNVFEWTLSLWGEDSSKPSFGYPYNLQDGREDTEAGNNVYRVIRGGAFLDAQYFVRCACRSRYTPTFRYYRLGFRLVVAPGQPSGDAGL